MDPQRLVLSGLNADVRPELVPPDTWTGTQNMVNLDGVMTVTTGGTDIDVAALTASAPRFIVSIDYNSSTILHVLCRDTAIIYETFTAGGIGITPIVEGSLPAFVAGTYSHDTVSGGQLNSLVVLNYLNQRPYYWAGLSMARAQGLTGWPAVGAVSSTCALMRTWRNRIFIADVTDTAGLNIPNQVSWSNSSTTGLPTEWVATSTNDAGTIYLSDSQPAVIEMIPLRDQLVLLKAEAMYLMTFTGGALQFSVRKVTDAFGVLAKNCAVDIGGSLVVLTSARDVILTDGQSFRSIATQEVRTLLRANIGDTAFTRCFLVHNEITQDVWFYMCLEGHDLPQVVLTWNTRTKLWSFTNVVPDPISLVSGMSFAQFSRFNYFNPPIHWGFLKATSSGQLTNMVGNTGWQNGVAVQGICSRGYLDFGDPAAVKTVVRLDFQAKCTGTGIIQARIASVMNLDDSVIFSPDWTTLDANRQLPCLKTGRYFTVECRSSVSLFVCIGFTAVFGEPSAY